MIRIVLSVVAGALLTLGVVMPGAAARLGNPVLQTYLFGIDSLPNDFLNQPGGNVPIGLYGPLLDFANETSLVNGAMERSAQIGTSSSGAPVYAKVGVADDGDIFWVSADTARNSPYIGSQSQILMAQSFRKDAEDASLSYTYSAAKVASFFDIEQGTMCKPGTPAYCLRAEFFMAVEVEDRASRSLQDLQFQRLRMWSSPTGYQHFIDGTSAWPWDITLRSVQGYGEFIAELSGPVTGQLDLSGIAVGEEFEVLYTLWATAVDSSPDAPGRGRTAEVFARDPLGGNTGVSFDLIGLTPTNSPSPIPEPRLWMLLVAGLVVVLRGVGASRPDSSALASSGR